MTPVDRLPPDQSTVVEFRVALVENGLDLNGASMSYSINKRALRHKKLGNNHGGYIR